MLSTSAPASRDHLLDLLARVRHHRQRAERERRVRRLVHDDVVRDLVDERLALAHRARASRRASSRSFQVEDVDRAVAGADLGEPVRDRARGRRAPRRAPRPRATARARAARRASPSACSRRRASPRRRGARPGSRRAASPSKRWSTGSSPWPPVTITAGAPSSCSRSASSRRDAVAAGERLAPRAGSASRRSRAGRAAPTSASTASSCEQPRARARDHHRVDDERHRMLREEVGDRLDQRRARRASRSSPRRRRCRRRPRRAARARTPAAARGSPSRRPCSAPSARRSPTCRRQPAAANAFRSAWMPAPPPESELAIVSARGTHIVSLRRHDPDQVRRV